MNLSSQLILDVLATHIQNNAHSKNALWLDENTQLNPSTLLPYRDNIVLITNRYDIQQAFVKQKFTLFFNDLQLPENTQFDAIFLGISKERAVMHHILNCSREALKPKGKLIFTGEKTEGFKRYYTNCQKQLGLNGRYKKHKDTYIAEFDESDVPPKEHLNDDNFHQLRPIKSTPINGENFEIISKPGVYGWKKIDAGSTFLLETLFSIEKKNYTKEPKLGLDFGCGSGILCGGLKQMGIKELWATDNNHCALLACQASLEKNNIEANVIPSDCGDTLTQKFDLILCNPPFHKGFDHHTGLTEKFSRATHRLLAKNGCAYFVTNAFVGIEKHFDKHDLICKTLANNTQFKVMRITHI